MHSRPSGVRAETRTVTPNRVASEVHCNLDIGGIMNSKLLAAASVGAGVILGLAISPPAVQAAINYFDVTKTLRGNGSVNCPYGWKVTGGGVQSLPGDSFGSYNSSEYKLTGSYPTSNGWTATASITRDTYYSNSGWRFTTSSYSTTVYAICVQ